MNRESVVLVALLASLSPVGIASAQQPSFRDAISLVADSAVAYVGEKFDPVVSSLQLTADADNLRQIVLASPVAEVRSQAANELMPRGAAAVDLSRLHACIGGGGTYASCAQPNTSYLQLKRVQEMDGGRLRIHATLAFPSDRPADVSAIPRDSMKGQYLVLKSIIATVELVEGRWRIVTLTTLG